MRVRPLIALFVFASCSQKAPVVNVNTAGSGSDVTFNSAYDIEEGSALDLVVDTGKAGAMITTSSLPPNAVLKDGIFSFTPDYSQAGLYSITFTITSGTTVTTKTVGIRVQNVIHIAAPALTSVSEGGKAPDLTFTSNDPPGTIVTYTADLSAALGATFDPVTGKLTFSPSWKWLDTRSAALAIIVTAEGTEVDTGKDRISTAKVLYQINEATSFAQELVPLFLLPIGGSSMTIPSPTPDLQSADAHDCLACHDGSTNAPAGMDFHPDKIYDTLINQPIAATGFKAALCGDLIAQGAKRVTPGDLAKSLWFMKISGTDGNGNPGPPCGVQMPENFAWYWWSVTNQDAWNMCPNVAGEDHCREALNCVPTDLTCKMGSRLVRKAKLWIMAGALNN